MHANDLVVNHCCHRQAIEAIRKDLPQTDAEATLALVVEAIDPVNGGTFMVPSEEEEVVRELDFVG